MNFFKKVLSGVEWFGKEVGKAFQFLPKLIMLTKDGEKVAQNALPQAITVLKDAALLATAIAKDSGVFIKAFSALVAAISAAIAAKALNVAADEGVVSAFENFIKAFNADNVKDIVAAWSQLDEDTRTLDETVVAGLQKLEADAKS